MDSILATEGETLPLAGILLWYLFHGVDYLLSCSPSEDSLPVGGLRRIGLNVFVIVRYIYAVQMCGWPLDCMTESLFSCPTAEQFTEKFVHIHLVIFSMYIT